MALWDRCTIAAASMVAQRDVHSYAMTSDRCDLCTVQRCGLRLIIPLYDFRRRCLMLVQDDSPRRPLAVAPL